LFWNPAPVTINGFFQTAFGLGQTDGTNFNFSVTEITLFDGVFLSTETWNWNTSDLTCLYVGGTNDVLLETSRVTAVGLGSGSESTFFTIGGAGPAGCGLAADVNNVGPPQGNLGANLHFAMSGEALLLAIPANDVPEPTTYPFLIGVTLLGAAWVTRKMRSSLR
jgi:PEP-CTERM motif